MKKNFSANTSRGIKLYLLLLSLFCVSLHATAQISLSLQNATIGQAIESIKKQSKYNFFYDDRIAHLKADDLRIDDGTLNDVLKALFSNKDIVYRIEDNIVYLSLKSKESEAATPGNRRSVSGNVVDDAGEPLVGVRVTVKGTSIGTITDIDGKYRIEVPSNQSQLQFSHISYHLQTIAVGNRSVINVELKEQTQLIDEVVVTALGIKREKKLLGYSMQELKGDQMNQTGNASITGALQGKVAGVQMNISPTGLNGSTKITIRGNSSLTDNNQPLWIVDGIPFGDASNSNVSVYGGIDRGGTSVDINPEDIESISILKGPNAAALYGSRAGNGVILITTKKGVAQKGFGVNYNSSFTWTDVAETLNMQDVYGQGENGAYRKSVFSFGGPLDNHLTPAWWKNSGSDSIPYRYNGNKLKKYFRTGFSQNHTISIGSTNQDSHYRSSIGYLNSDGLFQGEKLEKINIDLNSGKKINKYLSMDSKISLSKTTAKNRPYIGLYGEMYQLLYLPNNISLEDLERHHMRTAIHSQSGTEYQLHDNWLGPDQDYRNPYWMRNQRSNMDERWRAFGYHSLKVNFTPWLYATGKISLDYYRTKVEETDKGLGLNIENIILNDNFFKSEQNFFEINSEFMVHGNNRIGEKIRVDYGVGANSMFFKEEGLYAAAQNMSEKGNWYLNSAGQQIYAEKGIPTYANQRLKQKKVNSLFYTFQLAYDDYLSFDMTGRNDWSSTLPAPHAYFYPSFNLSYIATEFMNKMDIRSPKWLTYAKLRLSYAQAGKDTEPYSLKTYNTYNQSFTGPNYNRTKTYVTPDFKPEMNTSYEAGLEMKFLNNRLGFDFTYYNSITNNQIMLIPAASSSTFKDWRINAGDVQNQGLEFALYTTPIQTKNFEFTLDMNLAHNNTVVRKLHPKKTYVDFGVDNFFVTVGAVEGGRLGDIFAARVLKKDKDGNLIINKHSGLPQTEERSNFDKKFVLGNIQPDLMMSIAPRFTFFKDIHVSALFDMKFGGNIVSVTEAIATHYGTAARTLDRRTDYIVPGVYENGTPNTKAISLENYYRYIGDTGKNTGVPENFVYDASYIKFRELSIGYSLNRKLLKSTPMNSFRLSFVARDLFYLLKHTPGTSPEGGFDTTIYSQAFDYLSMPNTRTLGFSISAGF